MPDGGRVKAVDSLRSRVGRERREVEVRLHRPRPEVAELDVRDEGVADPRRRVHDGRNDERLDAGTQLRGSTLGERQRVVVVDQEARGPAVPGAHGEERVTGEGSRAAPATSVCRAAPFAWISAVSVRSSTVLGLQPDLRLDLSPEVHRCVTRVEDLDLDRFAPDVPPRDVGSRESGEEGALDRVAVHPELRGCGRIGAADLQVHVREEVGFLWPWGEIGTDEADESFVGGRRRVRRTREPDLEGPGRPWRKRDARDVSAKRI